MTKLLVRRMGRLRSVSEKLNKKIGKYPLVSFKDDAFNEEMDANEIEDTLTNLVNDLYGNGYGNRGFQVSFDCEPHEDEGIYAYEDEIIRINVEDYPDRLETDDCDRLEIHNIFDLIDVESGCFQYFILFDRSRYRYQWVVASIYTVFSDCKTRKEMGLSTDRVADAAS